MSSGVQQSILLDQQDKPLARSEQYLILRLLERFGDFKNLVKAFEDFYDLDPDWVSHLIAYEKIREAEESALSMRSF